MRATPEALDKLIRSLRIDPHVPAFVELCRRWHVQVIVVSGGMDRVVRHVLRDSICPSLRTGWSGWAATVEARLPLRHRWVCGSARKLQVRPSPPHEGFHHAADRALQVEAGPIVLARVHDECGLAYAAKLPLDEIEDLLFDRIA